MERMRPGMTWILLAVFLFAQVMPVAAVNSYGDPNNQMIGNNVPVFVNNSNQAVLGTADSLSNYYLNYYKNGTGWDWLRTTNINFSVFSGNIPQWNINTFQPLTLKSKLDSFWFAQGQYGTGNNTANVGVGYRTMNAERSNMYGFNLFYDWQMTVQGENGYNPNGSHMRIGAGIEYFTGSIESRLNAYFGGLTDDVQVGYKDPYSGQAAFQTVAPGMDLTVGTDFSFWDAPWLKLAATGSWYSQQHGGTINGYNGSPLYATINAYLQVTPQLQINGGGSFGSGNPSNANIGFQFNLLAPPQPALVMGDPAINKGAAKDISYKMLEPVQRNNTITVERYVKQLAPDMKDVTVTALNSNGNPVAGAIVTLEPQVAAGSIGDGTASQSALSNEQGQAKFNVLVGNYQAYAQIGVTGKKVSANPAGDNGKVVNFNLYGGYTLYGTSGLVNCTIDVYDQHGNPAGFTYDISGTTGYYRDADGNIVLLGLNPGETYTIKITHNGVTDIIHPVEKVSNSPDKTDAEVVDTTGKITASGKGNITAQVTYSDGATPRSNITVSLLQGETVIEDITTQADGYTAFDNLAYGAYTLKYNNDAEEKAEDVVISTTAPGVTKILTTLAVAPDPAAVGTIATGVIRYADGQELADGTTLKIRYQPTGTPVYTKAYEAGSGARFGDLDYGTYKLYAEVPGQGDVEVATSPAELTLSGTNRSITVNGANITGNKPVTGSATLTLTANGEAAKAGTKYALTYGLKMPDTWYTLGATNAVKMNNLLIGEYYFHMKNAVVSGGTVNGVTEWIQNATVNENANTPVAMSGQYITTTLQTKDMSGAAAAGQTVHIAATGVSYDSANDVNTGMDGNAAVKLWKASTGVTGQYVTTAIIGGVNALTTADAATEPQIITLQPMSGAALTVTVKNSVTQASISEATVTVTAEGMEPQSQTTGSSGQVSFNVANGTYSVTVTKTGYNSLVFDRVVNGIAVDIFAPFIKIPQANTVFTVTNPNGDAAVAGAVVQLTGTSYSETTQDNGQVTFQNVPNGTYSYTVTCAGYTTASGQIAVDGIALEQPVSFSEITGSISGTATKAGASDSGGITVTLIRNGTATGTTTTAADGSFTLSGLLSGTYTLQFSADGYQPQSITPYYQPLHAASTGIVATPLAETTGSIVGVVTVNGGNAMAGATVQLADASGVSIAGKNTTTAADGSYSIAVTSGTYRVVVAKTNYTTYASNVITQGVNLVTPLNVMLEEVAGTVSGTVRAYASGALAVLGNATVTLCDASGTSLTVSTTTDSNGLYMLSPVVAGTYMLKVTKTGYSDYQESSTFLQPINHVTTGHSIDGLEEIPGTIAGTVTAGSISVQDAAVTLTSLAGTFADKVLTTGADGNYSYSGTDILSGGYRITVEKATYTTYTSDFTQGVHESKSIPVNLSLQPITISGTVSGESGAGASGVTVTLCTVGGTPIVPAVTATTTAGGAYTLNGVVPASAPGNSYVIVYSGGGYDAWTSAQIAAITGQNVANQDATLVEQTGSVGGVITTTNGGTALGGAMAQLCTATGTPITGKSVTTDAVTGVYTITGVKSGQYVVKLSKTGYTAVNGEVFTQGVHETVTDESYALVEIKGSISGTVTSSDAQMISGLVAVLQDSNGDAISGVTVTYPTASTYKIANVFSGSYKVQLRANTHIAASTDVFTQAVSAVTTDKNLVLSGYPDITGTISGLPASAIPMVTISPNSGTVCNVTSTGYTITNVAPNSNYTVTATCSGYSADGVSVPVVKNNVGAINIAFRVTPGSITGTVSGITNKLAIGAKVNGMVMSMSWNDSTYTINSVPPGTSTLVLNATGYTVDPGSRTFTVEAGKTVTADNFKFTSTAKSYYFNTSETVVSVFSAENCELAIENGFLKIIPANTTTDFSIGYGGYTWRFIQNKYAVTPNNAKVTLNGYIMSPFVYDTKIENLLKGNTNGLCFILSASGKDYPAYYYDQFSKQWTSNGNLNCNRGGPDSWTALGANKQYVTAPGDQGVIVLAP